jgi:hypothetical protein
MSVQMVDFGTTIHVQESYDDRDAWTSGVQAADR